MSLELKRQFEKQCSDEEFIKLTIKELSCHHMNIISLNLMVKKIEEFTTSCVSITKERTSCINEITSFRIISFERKNKVKYSSHRIIIGEISVYIENFCKLWKV